MNSILKELEKIDEELLSIIKKRVILYSEYLKQRHHKKISISDSEFEGKLWKIWSRDVKESGINLKILRNVYNYLNNLSYELVEREDERTFKLKPRIKKGIYIELPGPLDIILTRLGIIVSGIGNADLELDHVVLNDQVYELLKALNALEAGFSWEKDKVYRKKNNNVLEFDKKAIFLGQDRFNLYLMIFSAISKPGICKLTGDTQLKTCDLRPVMNFVPQMGARIVPLIPGSYGLPIRIEATGSINDQIFVDESLPEEALLGLLVSCLFYPLEKIEVLFPKKSINKFLLERFIYLLQCIDVNYLLEENKLLLYPKEISNICIDHILDPELTSYLLSMPLIKGGKAEITGFFKESFSDSEVFLELFNSINAQIDRSSEKIISRNQLKTKGPFLFNIDKIDSLLPLATVFLCFNKFGGEIKGVPEAAYGELKYILDKLRVSFELDKGLLKIREGLNINKGQAVIYSPHPRWSVAMALFSLMGYEIILKNPGEITKLWPSFWSYYKSLPNIKHEQRTNRVEEKDESSKKRRRILVSRDRKIG